MKKLLFLLAPVFFFLSANAQTKIDSSFTFQLAIKKYSLYIPSSYSQGSANPVMIGFHPWNTSRWDAISWRDTLTVFAEDNSLILVCPDGGNDGVVDDQIDTAFTSALLDSVRQWYTIDEDRIYAMGFSVGGRATYKYGLSNPGTISGMMPIGAAVNGTSSYQQVLENGNGMPVYIIHGTQDAPSTRFFPPKDSLKAHHACVDSNYMAGVGHTIDFQNRNQILSTGYKYLDSTQCSFVVARHANFQKEIAIYPNPVKKGTEMRITGFSPDAEIELYDLEGKQIENLHWSKEKEGIRVETSGLRSGIYLLKASANGNSRTVKILIRD